MAMKHQVDGDRLAPCECKKTAGKIICKMLEIFILLLNNKLNFIFYHEYRYHKLLFLTGFIFSSSCMKKSVSLSIELIDKGVKMNSFSTDESVVEVYLVSEEAIEGELLAKAMNASGLEISKLR